MITNKELNEVKLSPTKKDYYQIWNELLELADKISDRWSPTATNESDPGIVLLKTLTAVADKLNYNIDKNTLEAFMPSATQEESMRKLTEMMGYSMKYYQSATCKVNIAYKGSTDKSIETFGEGILFPKFTNLKSEDEDINYVTLQDFVLQGAVSSYEVEAIEGELLECESDNDNIISMLHLDDLNRYLLPEVSIAENGIFISNILDETESLDWRKVDNLNTQLPGSKVYKFGFDSETKNPYIQFPEDISSIIGDGLRIKYIRTNGLKGNIAAKVLCKLEKPTLWSTADEGDPVRDLSADNFTVTNTSSATNGTDPESLNAAYNNYKKTIGTFDTLITCRDYMNKIYQMTESSTNTTPLVSNIIVSDIRDDINSSTQLCSFNDYGICYTNKSFLTEGTPRELLITDASDTTFEASFLERAPKIEPFDLVLYPFKTVYGLNNKTEYDNSFKYSGENNYKIQSGLSTNKNIAHNLKLPEETDIVCIKNYLRLKAKINTTKKVTYLEEQSILNNVYKAIYTSFNARQLDFGEEIPYETIVDVIKKADYRIKDLSLEEPALCTKFCLKNGTELDLVAQSERTASTTIIQVNTLYNKLALRNILAGKIAAFQYDTDFNSEFNKTDYPKTNSNYDSLYSNITKVESKFDLNEAYNEATNSKSLSNGFLKLKENQVIQFRCPNFKTLITYPAYVNYFLKRNQSTSEKDAIPATFMTLKEFMTADRWEDFVNNLKDKDTRLKEMSFRPKTEDETDVEYNKYLNEYLNKWVTVFTLNKENTYKLITSSSTINSSDTYYYIKIDDNIVAVFNNWIKEQTYQSSDKTTANYNGIYKDLGVKNTVPGLLVDSNLHQYMTTHMFSNQTDNKDCLEKFYVQRVWAPDSDEVKKGLVTVNGLGKDAIYATLTKDGEYQLKEGEYLLINYTDSKTDTSGTEHKTVVNKYWGPGTIIRPNFNLIDSARYHNNHSYSKKDGFSFNEVNNPEGMFTLDVNEQIEIRDRVEVELNTNGSCLYWNLKSDNKEAKSNTFDFTESYGGGSNNAYTLKEGEYLYYTNSAKQDLAYYGMGSIIVRESENLNLIKYTRDGEISDEEIMTNGLMAAIPWITYDLSNKNGLKIIENQYISLTAGDSIKTISCWDLGNNWTDIDSATYKLAEEAAESVLPTIAVKDIKWEARTRLDFNISKDTAQVLNEGDSITITYNVTNNDRTTTLESELKSEKIQNKFIPLHINSNYTCQSATDTIDFNKLGISNFKLKLSQEVAVEASKTENASSNSPVLLNNYINGNTYYTKFSFDDKKDTLTLNTSIPSDSKFGLMMIYCTKATPEVSLKVSCSTISNNAGIRKFNDANPTTLNELKEYVSELALIKGINIVEFLPGVSKISLSVPADNKEETTIIFGNLDIVKDINPKLDYRFTTITEDDAGTRGFFYETTLDQLLYDIRETEIVNDFYYNVPIQDTTDIDLNPNIVEDKLSSPLTWYDPNNVNNKFVISEIDADYLSTGITLSKSSRL